MSQEPIVTVQHLNHYFGHDELKKQVLFDIELEIKAGEIVIMMGPSGSGKTTLLTLIGGLRSVQEGSLKVFGYELYRTSKEQLVNIRRDIGYIFQAHNLLEFLTAGENVQTALELHKDIPVQEFRSRAEAMLKEVGLEHRVNYFPDNLSGGQKQKVAIARALVSHPKLLLADEPTAALDSKSGRDVVNLMQHLSQEQGCPILVVTHDDRILDIADRIVHMEDGRLTPEAISATDVPVV
jgi:putative ABC transport system ATP-binding protein